MRTRAIVFLVALLGCELTRADRVIFDAHLHYSEEHAQVFTPEEIIDILQGHNVRWALVTGTPAQHTASLYRLDPGRIVPFLGVYRKGFDKTGWYLDETLPSHVESQLRNGTWRGIGELHLFAENRRAPVFRRLVQLAAQQGLILLMHADPAVIDTIYEIAPGVRVLWAHAGTYPYPDLLEDYLRRYPSLYVDLSVRDERIAPDGRITDEWYNLFVQHPDRFLVGVDTYSTKRWRTYGSAIGAIRQWLAQLPADVADRLAYGNAAQLVE